jgi:HEAT repeat protein
MNGFRFPHRAIFLFGALLLVGVPARADSLGDRLISPAGDVRAQALKELEAASDREKRIVMIGLLEALRKDATSAQWAAEALAHMGSSAKEAIPDLVEAFRYDDATTYASLSQALVKIGPSCLSELEAALGDSNFFVRQRAAETITAFGPDAKKLAPVLVERLSDTQYQVHNAAEAALLSIGVASLPALADDLKTENQDMARSILTTLGKFGPPAAPILLETLRKNQDASVRAVAAEVLGGLHPASKDTVLGLADALQDLDEWVRAAIAEALGNLGAEAKAALGPLIIRAHTDQDPLVKDKAAQAIARIGPAGEESLPGLTHALRSDDPEVRKDALATLENGSLPMKDVMPLLAVASKDPDPDVRQKANDVMKKLSTPVAAPPASPAAKPSK